MTGKKHELTVTVWEYLLETGLSEATVSDLCRKAKLSQSSVYYWFENKEDLWKSAGIYGMSKVVDELFEFTLRNIRNVHKYFDMLMDESEKYKHELRVALQIATSFVFGECMRAKSKNFIFRYDKYAEEFAGILGCSYEQAETFIYSIISLVVCYIIWDDKEKTQILIDNLCQRIETACTNGKKI